MLLDLLFNTLFSCKKKKFQIDQNFLVSFCSRLWRRTAQSHFNVEKSEQVEDNSKCQAYKVK